MFMVKNFTHGSLRLSLARGVFSMCAVVLPAAILFASCDSNGGGLLGDEALRGTFQASNQDGYTIDGNRIYGLEWGSGDVEWSGSIRQIVTLGPGAGVIIVEFDTPPALLDWNTPNPPTHLTYLDSFSAVFFQNLTAEGVQMANATASIPHSGSNFLGWATRATLSEAVSAFGNAGAVSNYGMTNPPAFARQ